MVNCVHRSHTWNGMVICGKKCVAYAENLKSY